MSYTVKQCYCYEAVYNFKTRPDLHIFLLALYFLFPSPAGMSLTKLSLAGNNLIIPGQESLVNDIPAGDGKRKYSANKNIWRSGLVLKLYTASYCTLIIVFTVQYVAACLPSQIKGLLWGWRSLLMTKHICLVGHLGLSSIHLRLEDCRTFLLFVPATLFQGNIKGRLGVSSWGHVWDLQLNKRVPWSSFLYYTVEKGVTKVFLKSFFLFFSCV
jgi:hypothetical protein